MSSDQVLSVITGACLKCKHLLCKSDLLGAEVLCRKGYSSPHIKDRSKWIGVCDYLDYDDASVADWNNRFGFCRVHARERLAVI